MGGFRRFVLFVFTAAGILCLAALALPWFGLFDEEFLVLWDYDWYPLAVEVCLALTCAWLAFNLARVLFSRRRRKSLDVMRIDGGKVSVTRAAVASQATHVINASGIGSAKGVEVRAGKRGPVDLTVRLVPHESVDVTKEAPVLHDLLSRGVGAMVGERLGTIDIEFLGPQRESALAVPETADEGETGAGEGVPDSSGYAGLDEADVARVADDVAPEGDASASVAGPTSGAFGGDGGSPADDDFANPDGGPSEAGTAAGAESDAGAAGTGTGAASAAKDGVETDAAPDSPERSVGVDGTGDITIPMRAERED